VYNKLTTEIQYFTEREKERVLDKIQKCDNVEVFQLASSRTLNILMDSMHAFATRHISTFPTIRTVMHAAAVIRIGLLYT